MKLSKFLLDDENSNETCVFRKEKISTENVACFYQLANIFNLPVLHKTTFEYIDRSLTIINDVQSFQELDYTCISKILASSELLITSELEVYYTADKWLNYVIKDRSNYAKNILKKVRLQLLSGPTLEYLLNETTFFSRNDECIKLLNEFLDSKIKLSKNNLGVSKSSRYHSRKEFGIFICGGYDVHKLSAINDVEVINMNGNTNVTVLPKMIRERSSPKVVCVKGEIYVFGGFSTKNKGITSVDKYSPTSKTWSEVAQMNDNFFGFCICKFLNIIYVFGGITNKVVLDSCLKFDTRDYSLGEVSRMKEARDCAACAVFEERVVVSGGWNNRNTTLSTSESYDVIPDRWSSLPNMNSSKGSHSLVVVKIKLFVISQTTYSFEVFDNICKRFITLNPPNLNCYSISTSIGNRIYIFKEEDSKLISYDVDKNEWLEESCEVTENLKEFSVVKVPCL